MMVATIKVLQGGAKSISKYFELMQDLANYYGTESLGEWTGHAAQLLGLNGRVQQRDFENLLTGRSPNGDFLGSKPHPNSKRVPGIDVTFSAPKSVSVLWAIGDARIQYSVCEAIKNSVRKVLHELQSDLPLARRGKGGKLEISAKLIVAMFMHELSRANDPQLHIHCIIPNVCFGSDGKWSAVNSRKLHEWTMALGGIFRGYLCQELEQRLNVTFCPGISRDGTVGDWHEVADIPQALIDHFSKRSAQIQSAVDSDKLHDAHARQRANFATRNAKNEPKDRDAQRDQWREIASQHGIDWQQLSDSLADQSVNPKVQEWREMFQHQTTDVLPVEEMPEESEVVQDTEAVFEARGVEIEIDATEEPELAIAEDSPNEVPQQEEFEDQKIAATTTNAIVEPTETPLKTPEDSNSIETDPKVSAEPVSSIQTSEQVERHPVNKQSDVHAENADEAERKRKPGHQESSAANDGPPPNRSSKIEIIEEAWKPRELTKREERLYEKRFAETAERLAERRAYYSASEFAAALGKQLRRDSLQVPHLIDRVRKDLEKHRDVVVLPHTQRPLYSSRTYFEKETSLVEDAKTLRGCGGVHVNLRTAEKHSYQRTGLNAEQAKAAFHLLTQSSGLKMITTAAGSGHEKTLTAVREAFEKSGRQVVGTALSGRTSSAFEKSTGIQTRTLASWLYHLDRSEIRKFTDAARHEAKMFGRAIVGKGRWERSEIRLPKGGVVVVEQAGMIDTHGMSRLLHHAKIADCTVILAGDKDQLQPIGLGGPLEYLQGLAGSADLNEHHRQESEADRIAVDAIRDQRPEDAIQEYVDRGRFRVSDSPETTLVNEWAKSNAIKQPQKHIILTPTKKLRNETNDLCQQERLTRQLISGPGIRHGDQRYYAGDRIRFTSAQRRKGINTGDCGTVTGVNPLTRSINVRLDEPPSDESQKRYGARQTTTISLLDTDKSAMQLGYAATTHQVHGGETDHVWVLVDGGQTTSELAYAQISHGRESTRLFAQRQSDELERSRVAEDWSVSQKKDLAHDQMTHIDLNLQH